MFWFKIGEILHNRRPLSEYLPIIQLKCSNITFRVNGAEVATISGDLASVVDFNQFKLKFQFARSLMCGDNEQVSGA
jgi:hypothetical protein